MSSVILTRSGSCFELFHFFLVCLGHIIPTVILITQVHVPWFSLPAVVFSVCSSSALLLCIVHLRCCCVSLFCGAPLCCSSWLLLSAAFRRCFYSSPQPRSSALFTKNSFALFLVSASCIVRSASALRCLSSVLMFGPLLLVLVNRVPRGLGMSVDFFVTSFVHFMLVLFPWTRPFQPLP